MSRLDPMIRSIAHRGPDGQGKLIRKHAALGHARLAIIDLAAGAQPMSAAGGQLHIVFNGEIYNYPELRDRLEACGHLFRTHSDTEVILSLYKEYGLDAFQYLRGMFAIVIWDEVNNRGVLVRDENGIKPLFYQASTDGSLVFASEAKAIMAKSGNPGQIDTTSLHLLMNFRYLPGNRSLFKSIHQLEPGKIMVWTLDGEIKTRNFSYRCNRHQDNILDILEESVRLHLVSDVEVGGYLSGGIDSACINVLASRHMNHPMHTFTLNIGDDPTEAINAGRTAGLFSMQNRQTDVRENIGQLLPGLIWHLEVPKINALQVNEIARLAAGHVKVVLSGLGGDELFLGYNVHRIMYQVNRYAGIIPGFIRQGIADAGLALCRFLPLPIWPESERAIRIFGEAGDWPRVYGLLRNVWDNPKLREKIYGPRMLDEDLINVYDYLSEHWPDEKNPVKAMAEFEWKNKLVNDLLWQEDRCSMSEGLEVRVPFLDPVLCHSVRGKEPDELMPGGRAKGYMRSLLGRILPGEIMDRPKSGFQVDAAVFFQKHLDQLSETFLSREAVQSYGLFNPGFIEEVRAYKTPANLRWHYFMLYLMLTTHIWIELFENESGSSSLL